MPMFSLVGLSLRRILIIILLTHPNATWSQDLQNTEPEKKLSIRMNTVIETHIGIISQWLKTPEFNNLLIENNKNLLSVEEIEQRDQNWIQGKDVHLYEQLKSSLVSQILQAKIINSKVYVEAFVCDQQGVIVALYPKSSDYWQGDEAKFINSFNQGKGSIFIDKLSFDDSTNMYSVHVSIPIFHDNKTIGILIVGIKNITSGIKNYH
ncbi:hypothetical protein HQQ94_00080 [Shewanella sp. VB17]|uniref:PDC sensor domain-containing protein n=1 Tax=Shewanella sp. VB17 TaxID=2739432 RepID=UPI0015652783|nr:PDC sensor domain-containing protein [Shewanella sp. VB17]NRD71675.1 hypothetical protein [Shewanella sp. VB17]